MIQLLIAIVIFRDKNYAETLVNPFFWVQRKQFQRNAIPALKPCFNYLRPAS